MTLYGMTLNSCGLGNSATSSIWRISPFQILQIQQWRPQRPLRPSRSPTLFACVELGDAASAVHVYRLIQYDLAGVPLGSRISGLNHHAISFPLDPDADLSRSALVVPLLDLDLSFLRGTIIF
ncbi:hypothetical protein FCM35_KLT16975 [Carex littledalei]|uniref:Uncharacterized protein n=1 Tax=Carex littledalei TaxID=544730 RepID=A0A833RDX2_9POAL|nr:hypothetical protein FCM35_KLT16975 [Carex littledalei]